MECRNLLKWLYANQKKIINKMKITDNIDFIHIPKTGGSAIGHIFKSKYKALNHELPNSGNDHLYRFCFIRNPVHRFISAFEQQNKLVRRNIHAKWYLRKRIVKLNFNFKDFINSLTPEEIDENTLFYPMVKWIDGYKYDYIGRFETFDEDVYKILDATNYLNKLKNLRKMNVSKKQPIEYYIDEETFNKIIFLYKKDFEKFNYSMNINDYID